MHIYGKERKVYAVRRHNGSLCTQKQPETAAGRALKAATRERRSDPKGVQPHRNGIHAQSAVGLRVRTAAHGGMKETAKVSGEHKRS